MKNNAKLRPNYFSVNGSTLAVVFFRQISILPKTVGFFKFVGEMQQLVQKPLQKDN